ncbi:MAG: phosphatidylglycerol lysyltransferase domain-containing protein, partial [Oscillospiraceae bacterium]
MLELREVTIEDRDWVTRMMKTSGFRGSEYTFSNLFNWASAYTVRIAVVEEYLIVRSGQMVHNFMFPAGVGDLRVAVEAMEQSARDNGQPFRIYSISTEAKQELEMLYPGRFVFKAIRDNFDYIYSRESLATLAGKKLHGKRNHIARFRENNPDWSYEPLTEKNLSEAWAMNVEWCRVNGCHETHSLQREA